MGICTLQGSLVIVLEDIHPVSSTPPVYVSLLGFLRRCRTLHGGEGTAGRRTEGRESLSGLSESVAK